MNRIRLAGLALLVLTISVAKGFPTAIEYDGALQAVDDEITYWASDVHTIPRPP